MGDNEDVSDTGGPGDRPFRISEVARLFGVSVQAVHQWIQAGRIRGLKRTSRRGTYLIPRAAVARLLQAEGREVPGLWTRALPRVLVIDDDPGIRALAEAAARSRSHPFDLRSVAGLEDGLLLAAEYRPDVILVDYLYRKNGPRGDDALSFIRHARVLKDVRVVALAGHSKIAKKMRDAGADAVLMKPFGLDEFRIAALEGVAAR